ncbi:hypothetical protein ANO11243_030960 [Dothideomycetidae sp. 11243]|nr:hypothetical protein ANO11243_030960 [fungal sp. No.11243]
MPAGCPLIVLRIVAVATSSLGSLTRLHQAAAKVLVRLLNRPDAQSLQLHEAIIPQACKLIEAGFETRHVNQKAVGYLRLLVGIVATCGDNSNSVFLPSIWTVASTLFDRLFVESGDSSAVNRKLIVKLLQNISLLCLQPGSANVTFLEQEGAVEGVIDMLLQSLNDRDTQVRFAAAKALGAIISRLDRALASQVIDAVVSMFGIDSSVSGLDFSFEEPHRWHGLTLSLAHTLFGRSVLAQQLPSLIEALLLALNFEKRAVTGNSLGTNVRDSACFAIWSLSRRYTTTELLAVDMRTSTLVDGRPQQLNFVQFVALQLMVAACLDPIGNVRRGCSAALQELIGRHPDEVQLGISLVQIIDYQSVGLRHRAMVDLVHRAATLNEMYWHEFLANLQGWRGIGSPDLASRQSAAESIGRLSAMGPDTLLEKTLQSLGSFITQSGQNKVESQQGALLALCAVAEQKLGGQEDRKSQANLSCILDQLGLLSDRVCELDFTIRAGRADLPSAVARFCTTLCKLSALDRRGNSDQGRNIKDSLKTMIERLLMRSEKSLLVLIPNMTQAVVAFQSKHSSAKPILNSDEMLQALANDGQKPIVQGAARAIALATLLEGSPMPAKILSGISGLMRATVIDWRVLALRAMLLVLQHSEQARNDDSMLRDIIQAVLQGLADYTITERGDVGSLARYQALACVEELWRQGLHTQGFEVDNELHGNVLKLSLEKLDRVRRRAWQVMSIKARVGMEPAAHPTVDDVSSKMYFYNILTKLGDPKLEEFERNAMLKGLASIAGGGAENTLQASRAALVEVLQRAGQSSAIATLTALSSILMEDVSTSHDPEPVLGLLALVLDNVPMQHAAGDNFKWRTLLSRVQKSHFKSAIASRLLAAVEVYRLLGTVDVVRAEVVKKVQSMATNNPIARVRQVSAEAVWCLSV